MEPSASSTPWQPITFGGVARFARAPFMRLFLVQFIAALLVAASVVCFLAVAWFPVAQTAIAHLPEKAALRRGQLEWAGPSPSRLAEATFLSIVVDVENGRQIGQIADVRLELRRSGFKIGSLFGQVAVDYPDDWTVVLNHAVADSWWGAWRPFLLASAGAGVVAGMMGAWLLLATIYSLPLRLVAFWCDRQVAWSGCWRVAGAAQVPPALLMSGAIFLYAFNRLDLVGLLFAWLLHIVIGWIYLGLAPTRLPPLAGRLRRRENPFGEGKKKNR
jgi:hypothetical protein